MKINAININSSQQSFSGFGRKNFYQEITERKPMTNYYKNFIRPVIKEKVIKKAMFYGKPVKIASLSGEGLLVNVGVTTKFVDGEKNSPERILAIIENLIRGNDIAEERGIRRREMFFKEHEPCLANETYIKQY